MKHSHGFDDGYKGEGQSDPEAAIERVLSGLGEVRSAPDFEGRLLQRLAERRAVARHGRRRGWIPLRPAFADEWPRLPRYTACAAVVAAVLLAVLLASGHRRQPASSAALKAAAVRSAGREAVRPARTGGVGGVMDRPAAAGAPYASTARVRARRSGHQAAARREEAVASFPAPPMPLTAQERLLLRAAHAGASHEPVLLDPDLRASVEAARAEEFHRFFIAATEIRRETSPD